jgi:hypothetical protein
VSGNGYGGHEGYASPLYSKSFRLLRCTIFSVRESGVGHSLQIDGACDRSA